MNTADEKKHESTIDSLMTRRTIVLSGKITKESAQDVARRMLELQTRSSEPIKLIIDCGGGNTHAALQLCDVMENLITAPVHGIALGACGSAATFVMLYCKKRSSTPHSRFLIHSGTMSEISLPVNQTTSVHVELLLKDVKKFETMVTRIYMNRLTPQVWANGKPGEEERREFVQRLIQRGDQRFDEWFIAEEAVEIGLIEEIKEGKLDVFT